MTEGLASVAPPGAEKQFGNTVPMGRAGHVDDLAGAAVFLAGDLSTYLTGQTLHVDGGTQASSAAGTTTRIPGPTCWDLPEGRNEA